MGYPGPVARSGCASAWCVDVRGFDPRVRQHSFLEIALEIISRAILSLPLIQMGQLSITGEKKVHQVLVNLSKKMKPTQEQCG